MKKIMFITAGLALSLAVSAQKAREADVPAAVKESFKKSHPNAKEVKWEKEGANYEAEFETGETEQSVVYDVSGRLVETEVEIKPDELPSTVKVYITEHRKGMRIKEASKITDAKGTVSYEAEIKGKDLLFDSNGKFIKEEAVKD
jgi:hypothetical protein